MIVAVTGETTVRGNIAELTQDFCSILGALMDSAPEIIVGCETEFADELLTSMTKGDNYKIDACRRIAAQFKELNKENEDD